jgi:hypothetical protein
MNDKLIQALEELVKAAEFARVFIASREKMHPHGRDLHDEAIAKARAALAEAQQGVMTPKNRSELKDFWKHHRLGGRSRR